MFYIYFSDFRIVFHGCSPRKSVDFDDDLKYLKITFR